MVNHRNHHEKPPFGRKYVLTFSMRIEQANLSNSPYFIGSMVACYISLTNLPYKKSTVPVGKRTISMAPMDCDKWDVPPMG